MLLNIFRREYNEEEARAVHESSNNTSSDCSSVVESKPRRFRNNNSSKEGNKNISRKKDINKVISGKVRKKNPDKIKASVKKVPVKKPIIKVKLNMKKKTPTTSPSKEANSELIEENNSSKLPPTFNPVDNLFSKLKQQIEHSQPGPSRISPQNFIQTSEQSSVCKINVNRQIGYVDKSKKSKKLGKKRSIIHERLAMPLLPGGHESVTSSDSSGFKEDLTSSSSHTSTSPISEQELTITTADVIVVTPEVPKVLKQKVKTSPRNKGDPKVAANDEVFWINSKPMVDIAEDENLLGNDVIVVPDNVTKVPYRNPSTNNVIIINETRVPRLSPRSKKTNEKTQETSGNKPNISSRPIYKLTTTQSGEKSGSDLSAHSQSCDVEKTNKKQTTSLLKTVEPVPESIGEGVQAEKSLDKPRRRRRLMPTAIPSIFFNPHRLLRSELAQKKSNGPEKKPVPRGLPRLLRSELNKQEKPPKSKNNSQITEEASTLKLSKPFQKNYKLNDNLIYEVVKPTGAATTHTSNLSESSSSSGNEVLCLEDAPPKVEPLIIKLKVSQQKNSETSPKTKGAAESAKEKRNSYDNSDSISLVPDKALLKPQVSQLEDTKSKESVLLLSKLESDTYQLVKHEISAVKTSSFEVNQPENVHNVKTTVLPVKNYDTLKIDTLNQKTSPNVASSPKKRYPKVSPKLVEINLVQEMTQETEVPTKNWNLGKKEISTVDTKKLTPEKLAVNVSPKPVKEKVQKESNEKEISIVKLRETTQRLLRPEKFCSKSNQTVEKVESNVILISDETQTSSDVTNELPSQKVAVVACQSSKESAESKNFKMFPHQELSHIRAVPEIIDLISFDQTDIKESKKSSDLEKRITIHSDFKLQFMKNEELQSRDDNKNWNSKDNINENSKDINKNVSSKDISKIVNSGSTKNVALKEKSTELEEVKFISKTTRSSVLKEQLISPKTELADKNIEVNIIPMKKLTEKGKTEELDTVDLTLENISGKESKRTLRSEMIQHKSTQLPAKTVEIKKSTKCPLDITVNIQKSLEMPQITKTSIIKPSEVGSSKISEIHVANTVMSEKNMEKTVLTNKEPEVADLPQRFLRSDKGQQKLSEDKNKNILADAKIKPPKSDSSKQGKKTTPPLDLSTELSKKIENDIETLQTETNQVSPKTDGSKSSIGQKSQKKQDNLDEIIVLSDKKAKKQRESTTRLLRSSIIEPLSNSEPSVIKSEMEKVVVLIHDEPKCKHSMADTDSAKGKLKSEILPPRTLRSQKKITNGPPVKLNNRKGRNLALSVGEKNNLQDNKAIKNKPSMKTHTPGVVKHNKKSKAPRVHSKNGASVVGKKKIPITKKMTRQKVAQSLGRLRHRAVANVPKNKWLPAKARAKKLQKQVLAKNKKTPKGKKSVEWKNNEIIEKIIQEIRNTIFQDDHVEDNLQLEEGNISSEENSPKENIVPSKKKTAETSKVSDKKKKVRRPSLKEIRNTKNTRANLQRGRYKTRQGIKNAKSNPKLKAYKRKLADTTSKRASQRVAQKVSKEDLVPNEPSMTTVDSKEEEIEVPNNVEPKKESEVCRDLDEAEEADNETKAISNGKETYQMVNSYLEEIVEEEEENKTYQLKRKSEDMEHEVVAKKQCKIIPEKIKLSCPQLNQNEATVYKSDATESKFEQSSPQLNQNEATVSKADPTVYKAEATAPEAEATAPEAEATAPEAEATAPEAEATAPEAEATAPNAKALAPKAEAPAPKAEAPAPKADPTVSKAEDTVTKDEATVSKVDATVIQAEEGTVKAVEKATKRRYKKRTLIKSVKETPVVDVKQSSTQLNELKKDKPTYTIIGEQKSESMHHMLISENERLNEEDCQSVKTDGVRQDDVQDEAKRQFKIEAEKQCKAETEKQCKTEFVRILEKLVKEILPTKDLEQSRTELDQASCSTFHASAKMVDVIKRLCVDNEERKVPMTSEVQEGTSKKADITVFDFDESEPEVTPLRHKASPEKPTVAGKDKMGTPKEQPMKEISKKAQRRPKIKEENAKAHDVSQTSINMELNVPKKMWSHIEPPMKEVAKKAQRRPKVKEENAKTRDVSQTSTNIELEVPKNKMSRMEPPMKEVAKKAHKRSNTKEEYSKIRDESRTSTGMELEVPKKMWSRIEALTEMKPSPPTSTNKSRKSLEVVEAADDHQGSPTKATSPMKQLTIIEMFNKVRLKLEQGGTTPESVEDSPVPTGVAAVATQSRASIEEANISAMPPPKMERPNYKTESMEDDDSDCESRAEWIPEEYAEYKMKYSAQKMMQYKPVFKCKVCLKVFPSYYRLTKHRKEHELTENPYVCRQCEANFCDIEELTAHLRVHKGKFPYTCSKCSAGFWTKQEFDSHAPIHVLRKLKPPVKKFRCDVCAKEFGKLCDIDRHMRVHTGEKPCICNICNKGFQQSHNLSKHLLTHLHIRPFHCEICDKQFGRGDVLARHVLTHSLDKPIKCWVCYKGFIRQTQLLQHHQKYHADRPLVKPEPEEEDVAEEVA